MRAGKVFLFIISVVLFLVLLSYHYPKDGLNLGSLTLRFATWDHYSPEKEEIVVIDPVVIVEEYNEEKREADSLMTVQHDTMRYYQTTLQMPSHFYYPNNDFTYFDAFFEQAALARTSSKPLRILHYGDSQIELDRFSFTLRTFFQEQFGGMGVGLLPLVQLVPTATVSQSYEGNYKQYAMYGNASKTENGGEGFMAKMFAISGKGTFYGTASKRWGNNTFRKVSVLLSQQSDTLQLALTDRTRDTSFQKVLDSSGLQMITWNLPQRADKISLSLDGNANIYGLFLDGSNGIAVDNIAMRGGSGTFFRQLNDSLLTMMYQQLNVGMFVLQFGGNALPAIYNNEGAENYVQNLTYQIKYLRRKFPHIPILFIGPADMAKQRDGVLATHQYLPYLVEVMKREIPNAGAAFWNMYEVMGGKNSMIQWVNKGWAASDYIHFSQRGAETVAKMLVGTFTNTLNFYEYRKQYTTIEMDSLWNNFLLLQGK